MANERFFLTVSEAADRLRLSASYLHKLRLVGGGPQFAKIGRRVVYRVADLDAWAADRLCASTSDLAR